MLSVLFYIVDIFFQFILSLVFYTLFYKFFEFMCTKGKQLYFKSSDILKEEKVTDVIVLLTGSVLLIITLIINFFYKPLIGFYFSSILFIWIGLNVFFPSKGRLVGEKCWVTPIQKENFIVTLNDHKILIKGETLRGNPVRIIYKEDFPKWLPPHQSDFVSQEDYEYMLKGVLTFLKKNRLQGIIEYGGKRFVSK